MDVLHALLSFERSEEYVGVLLPNEELRGRLSMLGEEDDGDILPVMVVVILLQHVSSSLAIRQNFVCVKFADCGFLNLLVLCTGKLSCQYLTCLLSI